MVLLGAGFRDVVFALLPSAGFADGFVLLLPLPVLGGEGRLLFLPAAVLAGLAGVGFAVLGDVAGFAAGCLVAFVAVVCFVALLRVVVVLGVFAVDCFVVFFVTENSFVIFQLGMVRDLRRPRCRHVLSIARRKGVVRFRLRRRLGRRFCGGR